jgi:hypothetical protein
VNNIKIDLAEIGCGGVDWTGVAQDRDKWRALVSPRKFVSRVAGTGVHNEENSKDTLVHYTHTNST